MAKQVTGFAERLRSLREEAGCSQYGLARKTGLSKQAVSQLELGEREPAWRTVQLLALALGVDCSAFLDPDLTLPEEEPARTRGRPRKVNDRGATAEATPKKPKRKT